MKSSSMNAITSTESFKQAKEELAKLQASGSAITRDELDKAQSRVLIAEQKLGQDNRRNIGIRGESIRVEYCQTACRAKYHLAAGGLACAFTPLRAEIVPWQTVRHGIVAEPSGRRCETRDAFGRREPEISATVFLERADGVVRQTVELDQRKVDLGRSINHLAFEPLAIFEIPFGIVLKFAIDCSGVVGWPIEVR